MAKAYQSRRKFITTLALLLGAGGLLFRYLSTPTIPARQRLLRAVLNDVPPNGALVFRDERLALRRDAGGVYAINLVCTHLGCTVIVAAQQLVCPCHGSRFDRQGRVLNGPADRQLQRLQVVERGGMIEVLA